MNTEEIIKQSISYFGRNRRRLKEKVLSFEFNGKQYRAWKKQIKQLTSQPFQVSYGIFDDVVEWLKEQKYSEIDWHWLGDLSWEFQILLNQTVEKGFDWDKKLALNCGGTARILRIYLSDIIPCFVMDVYYMTFNKQENYYEFGPIKQLSTQERQLINQSKKFLQNMGLAFLNRKIALRKHQKLCSDLHSEGNASLFDALFSDTHSYQQEIKRFNDKQLKDSTGKTINWNEYYDKNGNLEKREEYRYFPSRNVECVVTDGLGQIIEVKVWSDIDGQSHREFILDIHKEHKKRKRQVSGTVNKRNSQS